MRMMCIAAGSALLAGCGPGDQPAAGRGEVAPDGGEIAAAAAMSSESRTFREWRAICDNGNRCATYTGNGTGGWLKVQLEAGPQARPVIQADLSAISGVAVRLVIDGRAQTLVAGPGDAGGQAVPAAEVPATLARLAAARAIRLVAPDFEGDIPTAGVSAALLWIDERQGRLGTTTAMIRKGDRPASAVAAVPALPIVAPAPAVAQTGFGDIDQTLPAALEALPAVKACRAETSFSPEFSRAAMSARLDASTELWAVPCFSGAYNMGHDWYVTGPGGRDPRPAILTSASGETGAGTINGGYSPETRTLSAFAKGRGIGDCGTAQTWTWTGQGFVLTAESAMEDCIGITADFWPTTWRTQ